MVASITAQEIQKQLASQTQVFNLAPCLQWEMLGCQCRVGYSGGGGQDSSQLGVRAWYQAGKPLDPFTTDLILGIFPRMPAVDSLMVSNIRDDS